jgi:hypothetical protein
MARIRSVKPSLRTSRVVVQWPREVRYAWVLLWGYLDDEGRGLDSPKAIAGDLFPLDEDADVTPRVMDRWLELFATTRREPDRDPPLCRYGAAGARYLHAVYWDDSQRPNRPTPSKLPPCPKHMPITDSLSDSYSERFTEPLTERRSEPLTELPPNSHVLEVGGGEVGSRRGGGALTEPLTEPPGSTTPASAPPPPRTCPQHPDGTERPCRACKRAREAHELWAGRQRAAEALAEPCPKHRGQLARNCALCRSEAIAS